MLTHKECMLRMALAMICLGVMTFGFKIVFDEYRHTIFEDIYGRGVIFFGFAALNYVRSQNDQISIFDIRPNMRFMFLCRVICVSLAYIFLYLAIENTSSFIYVALMLCMLYPSFKFMSRYALIDVGFNTFDTVATVVAVIGMYFLYN